MSRNLLLVLMLLGATSVGAQTGSQPSAGPDAAPVAEPIAKPSTFQSEAGVVYEYPSDWELVDTKPMLPAAQLKAREKATSQVEKSAAECVEIPLMIRHGNPGSVIMVEVLPLACSLTKIKESDLPAVASGVAQGLQRTFDVSEPMYGAYRLGKHDFSIERAKGNFKSHPELTATLETTCSILKESLVCWMAIARDDEALRAFEQGRAALEGDELAALVPPGALKQIRTVKEKNK